MRIFLITLLAAPVFAQAPEIAFDSAPNFLKMPDRMYMGEAAGVASNSKGHIYVYTRTGDSYAVTGASRTFTHGGSRLFEFDPTGRYIGEIGQGSYGFLVAESVRVDPQDNIWVVDKLSSLVIKFAPDGRVLMPLGRKPEAIFVGTRGGGRGAAFAGRGRGGEGAPLPGSGQPGDLFNGPTDVAWDAQGNIYISDGFGNARIAKFDKFGKYIKSWDRAGRSTASSAIRVRLQLTSKGMSMSPTRATTGFRCSTVTERSSPKSPASARPPRCASRRDHIRSCTRPIRMN